MLRNQTPYLAVVISVTALYVALAIGSALTETPMIDEGMFASPGLNLATKGFMGTTVLEPSGSALKNINQRTYWVMPLHLMNQAFWYKVFGFSLFSMRSLSIFWGVIALLSWLLIMNFLTENKTVALLGFVLIAFDYHFIRTAAVGRMDMMSAALGFAALAAYLSLRERNFAGAILASQSLVVASGLTHFMGTLPFVGLLFITLYFDRRRIKPRHLAVAAIPYLVGAVGYGLYIVKDFPAYRAQFIDNAMMGGRLSGVSSPISNLLREFTERYPAGFGFGEHTAGHSGPIYLKGLILFSYAIGILGVTLSPSLNRIKGHRALLILTLIYFLIMSLLDGQKQTNYLIHIVPFYAAILAIWVHWCWTHRMLPASFIGLCFCGVLTLQIGGVLYRIKQNSYQKEYIPVINFLKEHTGPTTSIVGSSALGFGLGYRTNFVDDPRFGTTNGKRADVIVFGQENEQGMKMYPELYQDVTNLLAEEYVQVYSTGAYKIYSRQVRQAPANR